MTRASFISLLIGATFFLVSTSAAPSPSLSHLLSDQDLSGYDSSGPSDSTPNIPPVSSIPTDSTQAIPQQAVQVGGETDVVPTTGVFPNLIFHPSIQLYDPQVDNYQSYGASNALAGYGDDSDVASSYNSGAAATGLSKRQDGSAADCSSSSSSSSGSTTNVVGKPSSILTDTVIQPIVTIKPHALQPVPVPLSKPYSVPVPVGVSVPYSLSCNSGSDCDREDGECGWGQGGSDWGQSWGDDCDWGHGDRDWGC